MTCQHTGHWAPRHQALLLLEHEAQVGAELHLQLGSVVGLVEGSSEELKRVFTYGLTPPLCTVHSDSTCMMYGQCYLWNLFLHLLPLYSIIRYYSM